MLLSNLFLTSILAAAIIAFSIPPGQPDGLYEVFIDDRGLEVHRPLNATSEGIDTPDMNFLEKRAKWPNTDLTIEPRAKRRCGCGFNMNHAGCNAVVTNLKGQVERSIGVYIAEGAAWYSINTNVVAFLCNWSPGRFLIRADNYDHFYISTVWISRDCGSFVAGTVEEEDGGPRYGYMIHYPGLDFCGKAMGSKLEHC